MNNLDFFQNKFIFIHYTPCIFGSLIYHILVKNEKITNKFYNYSLEDIFSAEKTAHNYIFHTIENFHYPKDVNQWLKLNDFEKKDFFVKNLKIKDVNKNLYYPPQRIGSYEGIKEIKNIFPNSKSIVITIEKNSFIKFSKIYKEKLFKIDLVNSKEKKFTLYKNTNDECRKNQIFHSISSDIFNFYYEQQSKINFLDIDIILKFENFFDKNKFCEQIHYLFDKFECQIDKQYIENFYNLFYNANNKYF